MSKQDQPAPKRQGIVGLSISRPVGTLALASVVIVIGLYFLQRLPIDLLPSIDYPQIRVSVDYPGVSAEVLEEQVTRVLERNLADTENLRLISSEVEDSQTDIDLTFEFGTNLDIALQNTARGLEQARALLPDIDPPRVRKFDPGQQPVWQGGFSSTVRSEAAVNDWIENTLAPQLISIPGVSSVESAGGMIREIEVIVDPDRLHSYGIGMNDIGDTLAAANRDIAIGRVTSDYFDVAGKTEGLFTSLKQIENVLLPLPKETMLYGQNIRLSDVAIVRDGNRRQRVFARLDGTPAAQVSVYKLPDANTVAVADEVLAALDRLKRSNFIPSDIRYEQTQDPTFFIRGAISSVSSAALLGGALAMLMVLMFLGSLRKGFVIGLSIPIAIMATFSLMGLSGLTLNIMSLGGLALGVGLLLDNAIVMLENIYRHRDALGKSAEDAARDGASEVVSAITAGTLTNLAAVMPFLLVSGVAALVFREMILTIGFAILATLAAGLTIVPTLAALMGKLNRSSGLSGSAPVRGFSWLVDRLRSGYSKALPGALNFRWAVLGLATLSLGGAGWLFTQLGNEFLPQMDDGAVQIRITLPPGTPPERTQAYSRQVEQLLLQRDHVENVFTLAGGALWGGVVSERAGSGIFLIQLTPASERPDMSAGIWIAEAQRAVRALDLPGATIYARPPQIRGLRFTSQGNDLEIGVTGPDLRTLQSLGDEVARRLDGIPGLGALDSGSDDLTPLLRLFVDRQNAAQYSMSVSDIGEAVRDAVDGAVPTRYIDANQEYDVRVRLPYELVDNAEALGNLMLFRFENEPVLLRDVATLELGEGPSTIYRENQSRIVRVVGDINTSISDVGTIMQEVERRLADLEVPERYNLTFGGQWETIQDTNREIAVVVLLSIFLVFVVLAVQYERLSNPLIIMAAAPLALVGVSLVLWATSTPVSAPVLIGLILLIGIVVNNAILLVEYIELGRRDEGLDVRDAIVRAGHVRLRPILMTTLTTVLGMLPLAIGMGDGAEIMRPLALTVVGGLMFSMLLTLFVVPCLYLIINGVAERMTSRLTGRLSQA
ncbi:MAG TPA: efflux RND transporter permease subunit [Pseudomonas xinjiangensis]|uniref:Efflux RND transporter permease subunit n=2 Tax=root TaxID=1 RepID=A0A7V1FQS2_9GAMM|nr:efflux RND transporter permease subunit [Halopseudomonas xinjiangensis]HEC47404.1 efflux RND transporter permease subunit [Halopseudomonas xinjiangensis]